MGKFKKRLATGLAAVLALSVGASAEILIDDFRSGTEQNQLGHYWYFYTNLGTNNADAREWSSGQLVEKEYSRCASDMWEDIEADSRGVRGTSDYELLFKPSLTVAHNPAASPNSAVMRFSNLRASSFELTDPCYAGVGMGTNLTRDPANGVQQPVREMFDGVTAIRFWARVNHPGMLDGVVRFKVETADQLSHTEEPSAAVGATATSKKLSEGSYNFPLVFTAVNAWQEFTVRVTGPCQRTLGGTTQIMRDARTGACVGDLARDFFEVVNAESWNTAATHGPQLAQVNYTFRISDAVKIAWYVQGEDWSTPAGVTAELAVDMVRTVGGSWTRPGTCDTCVSDNTTPPTGNVWLLSDFDQVLFVPSEGYGYRSQNALGGPWYAFNDVADAGEANQSRITMGLWNDPEYLVIPGTNTPCTPAGANCIQGGAGLNIDGHSNATIVGLGGTLISGMSDMADYKPGFEGTAAPYIAFTMGTGWTDDAGIDIAGFAGIGTKFSADDSPWDATAGVPSGFTGPVGGIWFMYNTDLPNIIVSIIDLQSTQQGNTSANAAATRSVELGGTGGEWKSALLPWRVFAPPSWSEWEYPLDTRNLLEVQFRYEGTTGGGYIIVDNVYLASVGATNVRPVSRVRANNANHVLRASYSRGSVNVNWNAPAQISSGRITLVNMRGATVASQAINASGSNIAASLAARGNIPTGRYFVRIDARDVNGKRVVQQVPVNIVK